MSTFKKIIGFPNYESDGKTVRNIATQKEVTIKKGTGKFYLNNAGGMKKLIALKDMTFVEPPAVEKGSKRGRTAVTVAEDQLDKLRNRREVKAILEAAYPKHRKIFELNQLGNLERIEIAALVGVTPGNVSRDLWGYRTNRYVIE